MHRTHRKASLPQQGFIGRQAYRSRDPYSSAPPVGLEVELEEDVQREIGGRAGSGAAATAGWKARGVNHSEFTTRVSRIHKAGGVNPSGFTLRVSRIHKAADCMAAVLSLQDLDLLAAYGWVCV